METVTILSDSGIQQFVKRQSKDTKLRQNFNSLNCTNEEYAYWCNGGCGGHNCPNGTRGAEPKDAQEGYRGCCALVALY